MPFDTLVAPLAAFLAPAGPTPLAPSPVQWHGTADIRTTIYVGQHWLGDDFEPAEEQFLVGIAMDVRQRYGGPSFEVGYFRSWTDGEKTSGTSSIEAESCVHELWMGARWTYDPWDGPLHPYLGTGLSLLCAEYDVEVLGDTDEEDGWAVGAYGHGGIEWEFGGGWAAGIDLRLLYSTPAALQDSVPLDYMQAALTLSWTW